MHDPSTVFFVLLGASTMDIEVKTEADSNDATECLHDNRPTVGMFVLLMELSKYYVLNVCDNVTITHH